MELILKREEIVSFLNENNCYDGSEIIIWANIGNTKGEQVILVFNKKGILVLPITLLGKIQGEIIGVKSSDIDSIKFKNGAIAYKLIIDSSIIEVPTFRISKVMVGYKEHKEELAILINKYNI